MATTTTSTSILNTPQAADDYYTYTESDVLASSSILTLDVMANDSGGKSKTLYSIEASEEFIQALKVQDATGEANAQYFNGVKVWIANGKIMVDVSGADALATLGAQSIEDLDAGQQLNLSFAYTIKLGNGTLSVATVSLTINGEGGPVSNTAPVATPVTLQAAPEDTPRIITAAELLSGASDADGNALSVTHVDLVSGGGTLTPNGVGSWLYTPALDYNGSVSFSYTVSDGSLSTTSTASLVISPVNDAPTAAPVVLSSSVEDTPRIITAAELLSGASDVDGNALSVTHVDLVSGGGTLTPNGVGSWLYTPALDYNGSVSFSYTVSDGSLSTTSTASLEVTPGNTDEDREAVGTIPLPGSAHIGETLLTGIPTLFDPDGAIVETQAQWQYQGPDGNWIDIPGANGKSVFLDPDLLSEGMTVHLLFFTTDEHGGQSTIESNPVTLLPFVGDIEATGTVFLKEVKTEEGDHFIAADTHTLADPNGGIVSFSYQWQSNSDASDPAGWDDISDATTRNLDVNDPANAGLFVRVVVQTLDQLDGTSSFVSDSQFILGGTGTVPTGHGLLVETDDAVTLQGQWVSNPLNLELFAAQDAIHAAFGTLSVDVYGNWTYQADSAFNELAQGESAEDSISMLDANGNFVHFNIDITGTNDAAQVSGDISAVLTSISKKGLTIWSASGALHSDDVDNHLPNDFTASEQRGDSGLGTFTINDFGNWRYVLDSNVALPSTTQGILDSTTFQTSDGTTQTVYVAFNDAYVQNGTLGNDTLTGLDFGGPSDAPTSDFLVGSAGDDVLYGGWGSNVLLGGDGNDSLYANGAGSSVNQSEWLYGGAGDDTLVQSGGTGRLDGGAGSDYLSTVFGNMTFVFDTPLTDEGVDILEINFPDSWTIELDGSIYHLPPGEVSELGTLGSVGDDGVARLIFDGGNLYYDDNGGTTGDAQQIATIAGSVYVTPSHFFVTGGDLL